MSNILGSVGRRSAWITCRITEDTHRLLARTDVLVEDFRAFDADKVESAFLRDRGREKRLAAARVAVQQQPIERRRPNAPQRGRTIAAIEPPVQSA